MSHFRRIGDCNFTEAVMAAVLANEALFDEEDWRQAHKDSPHADSQTICLRMPPTISVRTIFHSLEVFDRPVMNQVPAFAEAVFYVASATGQKVARAMIVRLKAGGKVTEHVDTGEYADRTERYHLVLHTNLGVAMRSGNECRFLAEGCLWWFDKHVKHSVVNDGTEARTHLVVDTFK